MADATLAVYSLGGTLCDSPIRPLLIVLPSATPLLVFLVRLQLVVEEDRQAQAPRRDGEEVVIGANDISSLKSPPMMIGSLRGTVEEATEEAVAETRPAEEEGEDETLVGVAGAIASGLMAGRSQALDGRTSTSMTPVTIDLADLQRRVEATADEGGIETKTEVQRGTTEIPGGPCTVKMTDGVSVDGTVEAAETRRAGTAGGIAGETVGAARRPFSRG